MKQYLLTVLALTGVLALSACDHRHHDWRRDHWDDRGRGGPYGGPGGPGGGYGGGPYGRGGGGY